MPLLHLLIIEVLADFYCTTDTCSEEEQMTLFSQH